MAAVRAASVLDRDGALALCRAVLGEEADLEWFLLDATIVRASTRPGPVL